MAQVLDQMPEHLVGARRVAAGQQLRAGERVVEEVRFDLRVQKGKFCDGEFLLGRGLGGLGLLVAATLGDAAADRAGDRLGVLEVGAVVDQEPVAPRRAFRLADQRHAAAVVAGRDRREDLVARDAEPRQRVPASADPLDIDVGAADLGAHLQAVARALDLGDARQFADRRVEQVERLAGLQRNLHLPALAVGERGLVDAPGDQPHPAQVRQRAGDHERHREHPRDHDRPFQPADHRQVRPQSREQEHREQPGDGDAQDEEQALGHDGFPWRIGWIAAEHSDRWRAIDRRCDGRGDAATNRGGAATGTRTAAGITLLQRNVGFSKPPRTVAVCGVPARWGQCRPVRAHLGNRA